MALKRLTTDEMVQISGVWVESGSSARKVIVEVAELKGLLPRIDGSHAALLEAQPPAQTGRLASLITESAALDVTHDGMIRGVHGLLGALVLLADGPEQADSLHRLRDFLLPEGLDHTQKTYRGEAGAAELLASRLEADPVMKKLLKDTVILKKPLSAFVQRWVDAARQLGKLEDERASLEVAPGEGQGTKLVAARNSWIRAVNALVANAELAELDEAKDRLVFGPLRLAEKNADRRARGAGRSVDAPPPPADADQPG